MPEPLKLNCDIHSLFKDKSSKLYPLISSKGTEVFEIGDHGNVLIVEDANKNKFSVLKTDCSNKKNKIK